MKDWVLVSPLILLGLIPLVMIVFLFAEEFFPRGPRQGRVRIIPRAKVAPKIAYKKAILRSSGAHFQGVMGKGYFAEDESHDGYGFHAYDDFETAKSHNQEGNVMLEVILSGNIEEHSEGYTATRQRVLQVLIYRCTVDGCGGTPTHFFFMESEPVDFICALHRTEAKTVQWAARFVHQIPLVPKPTPFLVEPISNLPVVLPWLAEHKIVVATLKGQQKFIPTGIGN